MPSSYVVPARRKQDVVSPTEAQQEKAKGFKMSSTSVKAKVFQGPEALVIQDNPWSLLDKVQRSVDFITFLKENEEAKEEEDWEELADKLQTEDGEEEEEPKELVSSEQTKEVKT